MTKFEKRMSERWKANEYNRLEEFQRKLEKEFKDEMYGRYNEREAEEAYERLRKYADGELKR